MPLQYNPDTSEINYEGKLIGHYTLVDGVARVTLNITYVCDPNQWIVPLSWFDYGLAILNKHKPQSKMVSMTVETAEADILEEYPVLRFLTEKIVKRDGYIWCFHKTDTDHWPSTLHGHDYEKNLKVDAYTGDIYDIATRQRCKKLKTKELSRIQGELRSSADFAGKLKIGFAAE